MNELIKLANEAIENIERQLKKRKDKEEKLKKIISDNLKIAYLEKTSYINICFFEELEQILNDKE